ncbi:PAS domain S-box-containing protein [Ohtaekwangia koreensis]|uniref:histidine kinase n=2 Tax=Ohtaekwangia koreensis TaxID=688867 RepID=A0A1T5MNG7_9BACT|nr:PAS domain S-box-containing protein [Ohtaekwangia koreensis]
MSSMSQRKLELGNRGRLTSLYWEKMIAEVQDYAIILLDEHGIIMDWNKGAEKLKGYAMEEAIGKSFRIFYTPQDQLDRLPEKLINIARDTGKADHEGWRVRKDGTLFWGSIVITALHGDNGEVIGFAKVTRDLTERKSAEDRLTKKNAELELMNQELSSFAYVSSHDLQAPLRKIQSFIHRLNEMESDNLSDKGKEYMQRIVNTTSHMQRLIEDLLTYSRASTQERAFELVDLNEIAEIVTRDLEDTIREKNAVIEFSALPMLHVIQFQFQQLFVNLLSNSLKFSKKDVQPHIGITAEVISADQIKGYTGDLTKRFHHIAIKDNGIGFAEEYSTKIFEVFQRLHGTAEYSGTGIGLSICKKIVENHNGIIQAEGKVKEGATFHIYIPVTESEA